MADATDFDELLTRARSGDESAMTALVEQYEPEVRMVARVRLGAALRPHLDSVDLVQSVHKSLMIGLRADRYDISTPEQLIALALTIVRRKVSRQWRKLKRQQRLSGDGSGSQNLPGLIASLSASESDPAEIASIREATAHILSRLDETETRVIELRLEGYTTAEVARQLGLDADVLRVKLSRLRRQLRERGVMNELL
jgi:RNA polymerase sigma-70 factor (ECF subfamily)